jgi:hypothetical protein
MQYPNNSPVQYPLVAGANGGLPPSGVIPRPPVMMHPPPPTMPPGMYPGHNHHFHYYSRINVGMPMAPAFIAPATYNAVSTGQIAKPPVINMGATEEVTTIYVGKIAPGVEDDFIKKLLEVT